MCWNCSKSVVPPFWAAYPTLGHGPVNWLPVLRSDVRAASRAIEAFAGSFAASGADLDGEMKRELQRLDKAARADDLNEIRTIIRSVSSSIASSVERMRDSNIKG